MGMRIGMGIGVSIGMGIGVLSDGSVPTPPPPPPPTTLSMSSSSFTAITVVNFATSTTVVNVGANDAVNVTVTVTLDSSLTFVSGSGTGWTVNAVGQVVTITRPLLLAGDGKSFTITVTTGAAAVTATTTKSASADNSTPFNINDTLTVKLVDKDATSGIRCPSSLTQWQDFVLYNVTFGSADFPNVTPSLLWLCQDASGNLADAIGSFTGTAGGTAATYHAAVSGWSRFGIAGSDGATTTFNNTSASLPDPASASMLTLCYQVCDSAPAASRNPIFYGTALQTFEVFTATPVLKLQGGGSVIGTSNLAGQVRPFVLQHDVTNNRSLAASDQEKLTSTKRATTGKALNTALSFPGKRLYLAGFFSAAAELTDANIKALLQGLGWTIPWS